MHTLVSPNILNDNSFEYLINQLPAVENTAEKEILADLSLAETIDAYGLLGILELGIYLRGKDFNTYLSLPKNEELVHFICDSNFFEYAHLGFNNCADKKIKARENMSVTLGITQIENSWDIHDIVTRIREKIKFADDEKQQYIWDNIIVAISEICQNIPEHSQDKGFVMITLDHNKHYKKNIVNIVVMDLGIGIKNSLDKKFSPVFREKWSDRMAIHKTLFEGVSRYDDPGRGNGIIRTKELVVEKFRGNISLRSGTAKLWGKIPSWELERFFGKPLAWLPGTQVNINLPLSLQ